MFWMSLVLVLGFFLSLFVSCFAWVSKIRFWGLLRVFWNWCSCIYGGRFWELYGIVTWCAMLLEHDEWVWGCGFGGVESVSVGYVLMFGLVRHVSCVSSISSRICFIVFCNGLFEWVLWMTSFWDGHFWGELPCSTGEILVSARKRRRLENVGRWVVFCGLHWWVGETMRRCSNVFNLHPFGWEWYLSFQIKKLFDKGVIQSVACTGNNS